MENKLKDYNSILPFLPLILESTTLIWPPQVIEALKSLSRGPNHSKVDSGEILFLAITDLRDSLHLSKEKLSVSAADGYSLFFDELMSHVESEKWFREVVPALASLLLRLPDLLEDHYRCTNEVVGRVETGLRLLGSQEAGIVLLSQELIGALLACSFFCLYPVTNRGAKHLPAINFDHLFARLYPDCSQNQEHKIKCLIHYFERICSSMPMGFVSFDRKVLPLKHSPLCITYPKADFWGESAVSLCHLEVCHSGLIEDQQCEALEVDFANKYIGGGALSRGCVQEEIRFMINPESIVGMLFLPAMGNNEAVEIVGAERFSNYTGYASSFRYSGDHVDKKSLDCVRRKKTRIIAIDALCIPGMRQYKAECLLREINKAFCGFYDQSKCQRYMNISQEDHIRPDCHDVATEGLNNEGQNNPTLRESASAVEKSNEGANQAEMIGNCLSEPFGQSLHPEYEVGIVTGNWGCGAFGGDPEIKTIIQWLAASQALRPFILYHTFEEESLQSLEQVSNWILTHEWTVGELWNMLAVYSSQRLKNETSVGFLNWLVPSFSFQSNEMSDPDFMEE